MKRDRRERARGDRSVDRARSARTPTGAPEPDTASGSPAGRLVRHASQETGASPLDPVFERHRACLRIHAVVHERAASRASPASAAAGCRRRAGRESAPTSTVSTRPRSRRLRNSAPPPNSQMSLPGSSRRRRDGRGVVADDGDAGMIGGLQRAGEDEHASCRRQLPPPSALPRRGLEGLPADEQRVEALEVGGEARRDLGVHHNPVVFAVRPRDVAVEAHGHAVAHAVAWPNLPESGCVNERSLRNQQQT